MTRTPDPSAPSALLRAYDEQVRELAEVPGAQSWIRVGPLIAARYASGRGFVTYRTLADADGTPPDAEAIGDLVARGLAHFRADPAISHVEWKTRGHDHAPGLHDALLAAGFVPSRS